MQVPATWRDRHASALLEVSYGTGDPRSETVLAYRAQNRKQHAAGELRPDLTPEQQNRAAAVRSAHMG
jgi:hypothetical protein